MTVLHLITGLQSGGAERQLEQLVLWASGARIRHVVVSLTATDGPIYDALQNAGTQVHSLDMPKSRITIRGWVRLLHILREVKPDVIHCWMYHACLLGTFATCLTRRFKIVWALRAAHSDLNDYSKATVVVIRMCALLSWLPNAIVLNSSASWEAHRSLGFSTAKMQIIPNGVNTSQFCPNQDYRASVRRDFGLPNDAVLIGMCARFDPMKDHTNFCRAAAIVRKQYPGAHFVLIGLGTDPGNMELQQIVSENKLENAVFLLGQRNDVPRITAALDVACLSSWTESFPNVVVEAMACGVPCVVTDAGDSKIIVGDAGIVVPVRDSERLAEGICELLTASQTLGKLGHLARNRAIAEYSTANSVQHYEHLYRLVASDRGIRDSLACEAV